MEQKTETDEQAAKARAKAEARRHMIFGAIAALVITGLIAVMFFIDDYGQRAMPGYHAQAKDAADDH
ncbi:MAG TPA: hypothetical protein VF801_14475 [Rhodocyclaceae bacterium]